MGPVLPLIGTPRSPERPTLGGRVAEVARKLGKPLMPHQRHIADVAMEIDPATGLLAYSQIVVIGPRQATGKTELALPVMAHRVTGFDTQLSHWIGEHLGIKVAPPGPQRVLYTAQTADDARKKWRDVHLERLKASEYYRPRPYFTSRLTTNKEALFWRNGSVWVPGSTTGKTGGTGDTIDLGVIDEAWSRPDSRTELGMRPAMMTRDWRQLWIFSMIPGISRSAPGSWPYLAEKRSSGREMVEAGVRSGVAFFDYSAAPGLDPDDPATWLTCMPGLGRTVRLQAVQEDHDGMDAIDFQAEYLGWAPTETVSRWGVVSSGTWENRMDTQSAIVGDSALGVEISEDRARGWIGAAGRRADRDWHVEIVEPGYKVAAEVAGVSWMVDRIAEICDAQQVCAVVIDSRRPAGTLVAPLRRLGIKVLTPAQNEIAASCGRFFDGTGEGRAADDEAPWVGLWHLGQPALDRALAQARRYELGVGAFVFVKRGRASEVGPLYAVTLAMHGHETESSGELYPPSEGIDLGGVCGSCGRSTYLLDDDWCHAVDDSPRCR